MLALSRPPDAGRPKGEVSETRRVRTQLHTPLIAICAFPQMCERVRVSSARLQRCGRCCQMADPGVAQWFRTVDTNGGGTVDGGELQKALALGGLNYDVTSIDNMIRLVWCM